jgi:hypothetical protein
MLVVLVVLELVGDFVHVVFECVFGCLYLNVVFGFYLNVVFECLRV